MTIPEFQQAKRDKKKLVVVTAYDALFTRIVEQAGIHTILVGDSLGIVVQGKPNTLAVTNLMRLAIRPFYQAATVMGVLDCMR